MYFGHYTYGLRIYVKDTSTPVSYVYVFVGLVEDDSWSWDVGTTSYPVKPVKL